MIISNSVLVILNEMLDQYDIFKAASEKLGEDEFYSSISNSAMANVMLLLSCMKRIMETTGENLDAQKCVMRKDPVNESLWWCSRCGEHHVNSNEHPYEYCPRCGMKTA